MSPIICCPYIGAVLRLAIIIAERASTDSWVFIYFTLSQLC